MKLELTADLLAELGQRHAGLDIGAVHINEMPLGVKHGILLMDTYGGTAIDPYIPLMRSTGLRLVVRSPRYTRGYRAAFQLLQLLPLQLERHVSGKFLKDLFGQDMSVLVKQVLVMNEPKPYRSSEGGYVEFELDVELIYIAPELHSEPTSP